MKKLSSSCWYATGSHSDEKYSPYKDKEKCVSYSENCTYLEIEFKFKSKNQSVLEMIERLIENKHLGSTLCALSCLLPFTTGPSILFPFCSRETEAESLRTWCTWETGHHPPIESGAWAPIYCLAGTLSLCPSPPSAPMINDAHFLFPLICLILISHFLEVRNMQTLSLRPIV